MTLLPEDWQRPTILFQRVPRWLRWLRNRLRASEIALILLSIVVGMGGGLFTVIIGAMARTMQHYLYHLAPQTRLSGVPSLPLPQLAVLPIGAVVLALFTWLTRARDRALVDAVEANALHGGRMSLPDSAIITGQTVVSNGFGASVGLEAAYAQMGALVGSIAARLLNLRRADVRILVGAGAGGAIAAAFGAPLAGAFYAFEIVIGAYTPSAIAPVAAAALAGAQVAQRLGIVPYIVAVQPGPAIHTFGYIIYAGLGASCALLGILMMRSVGLLETASRKLLPNYARPFVGGLFLMPLALWSPQTLSAGHSALHLDMMDAVPLAFIAAMLVAKCSASIVSLGFGFRGGLFFASLFLGTLVGHLYAGALAAIAGISILNAGNAAMVGMAAMAVGVVGGPMTMAMLVLEATGNFSLTGAVLTASLVSSSIVRELFGYSFSTWRLHLRGEAIQSARDVGWVRTLTAEKMMRRDFKSASANASVAALRHQFPLGSTSRIVLTDEEGRYAGIVTTSVAFAQGVEEGTLATKIAHATDAMLRPEMHIDEVMRFFNTAQTDELAVVGRGSRVVGLLTENFVRRRYAEELDKAQRELFGER
jgi:CIC family chloride channel protein